MVSDDTGSKRGTRAMGVRPTVAFLNYNLWHSLEISIWYGAVDAAAERGANLICFVGDQLQSPFGSRANANVLYELVSAERLDGVAMFAAAMGVYLSQEAKARFFKRYLPVPTVLLEEQVDGLPCIDFDFAASFRQLLVHLLDVHGYRRIALVRGPDTHKVAEIRYRVYQDVLAERGIPIDPILITPPSVWDPGTGREAVRLLVDERRVAMDAIIAASDDIAFGVIEALKERGKYVPDDVAVVGHDDIADSKWIIPSLTTVPNRAYEQGRLAIEVLLAQIAGEEVPERTVVPLTMVVRESCGCIDPTVAQAAVSASAGVHPREGDIVSLCGPLVDELARLLGGTERAATWAGGLLDALLTDVLGSGSGSPLGALRPAFLPTLRGVLRDVAASHGDVAAVQSFCSTMRQRVRPALSDPAQLARAEDLWQQARVMIGEVAQRGHAQKAFLAERQVQVLREVEAKLISTFNVGELMDVLADELPRLGIPGCYLSLYDDPSTPTGTASLVLAYNAAGRVELPRGGRRFPALQIIPDGILPDDRPFNLIAYPLHFRAIQLGFVVFEMGTRVGTVYEALRAEISSALQGALLVQRLEERTAALTREQYIINTFMENVPDEIYFKDRQGLITRANKAHARRFGFADPSQEIGKSDFDFFVEERARRKYKQEQEIMSSGVPAISVEEQERFVDGRSEWSLTTKMPLRDEHGEIIGTFGISRDITRLKEVEARVRRLEHDALEMQMAGGFAHEMRNALAGSKLALQSVLRPTNSLPQESLSLVRELAALLKDATPDALLDSAMQLMGGIYENEQKLDKALQLIQRCVNRALDVTSLISEYARLGRAQAGTERVEPYQIAASVVHEHAEMFAGQHIALSLHGGVSRTLTGYAAHFQSILSNLVLNARDALIEVNDDRPRRIDLEVWEDQAALLVRVTDTANGIAPELLPQIWKPFFSTKPTTGMGLGLSVVAKLVSLYAGTIEVSSEVGKGTTFTLRFPLPEPLEPRAS